MIVINIRNRIGSYKDDPRPCISVREGQKCNGANCRKQHSGMSGKKCSDSDYIQYGVCSNYLECKAKHPWDNKFGSKEDAYIYICADRISQSQRSTPT